MHPRNRHQDRYDFAALTRVLQTLARFTVNSPAGDTTIDFADPAAVLALNQALLKLHYGIELWDIPKGYLCPPIPGRADYIHYAADLLSTVSGGEIPRGESVRVLDVGVGANAIYPILGRVEYGWRFVGSDIDAAALASARRIVEANPALRGGVELRPQTPPAILKGVIRTKDRFALTLCNPPFNSSEAETGNLSRRKWSNLNVPDAGKNFGGQETELWTPGGEAAFAWRLINESAAYADQVGWFTTLISKSAHLPSVLKALSRVNPAAQKVIEMAHGQKKTRFVAWTFRR